MARSGGSGHDQVLKVIRRVRARWRMAVALKGLAVVAGLGLVAFLASAVGMDLLRFTEGAVTGFRVLAYVSIAALVLFFLVRPLARRVTDEQVALYLEEHEPSLQAALLSAVELGRSAPEQVAISPRMLEGMVRQAVERCRAVEFGRRVEKGRIRQSSGALAALAVLAVLVFGMGPASLRTGASALLFPVRDAAAVNPYSILVEPGDTTIARNSDQLVVARLGGFESPDVALLTRKASEDGFRRLTMLPADSGRFELLLLDVDDETEYYVESSGVRSAAFTLGVADLPYVDQLQLVYRFPAYTGLPPRTVDEGGDIAVLAGTRVEVQARSTIPAPSGVLILDEEPTSLELGPDGAFTGSFVVREDGYYRIELTGPDDVSVPASPQYTIDVLTDQPPAISFTEPGRDVQASPIDEVFVEARADDDFGVGRMDLIYSVNGQPGDTVSLYRSGRGGLGEVLAGHTFFLEEWELEPGDVISYYATVRDNKSGGGEVVTSDIYFIQARPFGRDYRQAEQQGGPPQGGGGNPMESALSELQRQVIAATFNLIRDRESYGPDAFQEGLVYVALTQARLREQVETLARRMANRGIFDTDPRMRQISELLPQAAQAMEEAEGLLESQEPQEALGPEQRALQLVLKAEETFERSVGQQQGGGGGGGGNAEAEELADLFELELDKLKNQYETVERSQQQQAGNQLDETLERLKELARRQQQEAERQRRRAANQQQGAGGGSSGDAQRALAEEAEEAARQLERLARENNDPQLQEVARELQEAAQSMRRSAASRGNAATAEASQALDRLEDAQRQLEEQKSRRLQEQVSQAVEQAEELARQQARIQEDVGELQQGGFEGVQQMERLMQRKDQLFQDVADLERQLDQASAEAMREDQREASSRLQDAASGIRDDKLKEKIRFSKGVAQERNQEYAQAFEEQIAGDIQRLRERLEDAESAIGQQEQDRMAEALDRTRDLVRGMESMEERLRQGTSGQDSESGDSRADQEAQGGESPEGARGQQGQEGQQGGQADRRLQGSDQAGSREGARGGAQAQGESGSDPTGGDPNTQGSRPDGGGPPPTVGGPGGDQRAELTPDQIRQFRSEARQREGDARDLRELLRQEGQNTENLDEVIESLEALQRTRVYGDPVELARLQDEVIQGLRRFEFALRRGLDDGDARVFLSGSEEVPPEFRDLVEEYYRSLSRDPGG